MMTWYSGDDPYGDVAVRERARLVEALKQEGMITTPAIESAFLAVPRHCFLDAFYLREQTAPVRWKLIESRALSTQEWCQLVYADAPLITRLNEIGNPTSSSSAPAIMACMLEVAALAPGQRVLEIGTGTGYNAALLAHLVGDPTLVTTIELEDDLMRLARERLARVVSPGVQVIAGDGFLGYAPNAPYDRILATASTQTIPLAWLDQLREGGIIVLHLQGHLAGGCLVCFQKQGPGRSGTGLLITGSDFMQLRTPSSSSFLAPQLLAHLLHRPLTCSYVLTSALFDPTLLWNNDLAFFLQTLFPTLCLNSISKGREDPPRICLLDESTRTLLVFSPLGEKQWQLEIRGNVPVWERALAAYHQWLDLGRPGATAYRLLIDACGRQRLVYAPAHPSSKATTWIIYEPDH